MKINYNPPSLSSLLTIENITAEKIKSLGIYIPRMFLSEKLFNLLVSHYQNNDFFWKTTTLDVGTDRKIISYFGLLFSLSKKSTGRHLNSYYLDTFSEKMAHEKRRGKHYNTPEQLQIVSQLYELGDRYDDSNKMLANIFTQHHAEIIECDIWDSYENYQSHQRELYLNTPLISYNHKLIAAEAAEEIQAMTQYLDKHAGEDDLYKILSSDNQSDVYLGDGLWLSSDGGISDEGR